MLRTDNCRSQVMFLTGCASGIGRHVAGRLAAAGHRMMLTDINVDALIANSHHDRWPFENVLLRRLDVRSADEWSRLLDETVKHFGPIDVLWNIAGYIRPGYVHETSADQIEAHLDINTKGTLLGSRLAAICMVEQGHGHIINIASMAALAPVPGIALYTASKFAVRGFTLALAQELRPHGVAVTVVCPDAVRTPMLDLQIDYPEAALTFSAPQPLSVEALGNLLIHRVLRDRPVEVTMPRWRGWLAKLTGAFPATTGWIAPWLAKQGRAKQAKLKARRERRDGRHPDNHPTS